MPTRRRSSLSRRLLAMAAVTVACLYGAYVRGQESDNASRVRSLNGEVLQRLAALDDARGLYAISLRGEAEVFLAQRAAFLASVVETRPADVLRLAFSADLIDDVATAFPGARAQLESHGVWRGPVEYAIEDDFAGRSHRKVITM